MPNWCYNTFTIKGSGKEMDKFKSTLYSEPKRTIVYTKEEIFAIKNNALKELKKSKRAINDMNTFIALRKLSLIEYAKSNFALDTDEDGNAYREEDGLLSRFYPMPSKITLEASANPKWYSWRCDNWGTKWDVTIDGENSSDCEVFLSFDSAWAPPLAWLKVVAEQYPSLEFSMSFEESGMCFAGCLDICVDKGIFNEVNREYFGTCGECEEEYDSDGHCECVGDNGKKMVWGEENEEEEAPKEL
jgi:hypothetical protein